MWIFGWKGPSEFSSASTAEQVTEGIDGNGLTAIVTGASSGIGFETTRVLALRGVHVVMAVRNVDSGMSIKDKIVEEIPSAKIDVMKLDLSSMASVRKFSEEYISSSLPLNILINNAGILSVSQDNIELQFATNHLGHFLLTNLLLGTMKKTVCDCKREGRIVIVSSEAHRYMYNEGTTRFNKIDDILGCPRYFAYNQTKLANILHAKELSRQLKEEGVEITANSLHPGAIKTKLFRNHGFFNAIADAVGKFFLKNEQQGAATQCYVALHPQVRGISGEYFKDCNIAKPSSLATDSELATKLWDFSLSLTDSEYSL